MFCCPTWIPKEMLIVDPPLFLIRCLSSAPALHCIRLAHSSPGATCEPERGILCGLLNRGGWQHAEKVERVIDDGANAEGEEHRADPHFGAIEEDATGEDGDLDHATRGPHSPSR